MKSKQNPEYDKFSSLLKQVISVPHSEIKDKLDAEKQQKKEKRPTSDASRASHGKQ